MNNKNRLILAVAFTFAAVMIAGPKASANTLILDYGTRHNGVGGEFNASSATLNPVALGYASVAQADVTNSQAPYGLNGLGFETFCVEYNEEFVPGGTYNYIINSAAVLGGNGGPSDPISLGTAFLYKAFATDTFSAYGLSYDYSTLGGASISAANLQTAIWWLEDEDGLTYQSANPFEKYVHDHIANYHNDNNGFYNVAVLNIYYLNGAYSQDQLMLLPESPVPDGGASAMLLGLGLLGLFLVNRQLNRRHLVKA